MTVIYVIVALVTGFSLFDYYVNRNWEAITSVSRNEAVFAHRNREYGAYVLRSGYNKRMTLILGGLVALAALAFVATLIIKNLPKEERHSGLQSGWITSLREYFRQGHFRRSWLRTDTECDWVNRHGIQPFRR